MANKRKQSQKTIVIDKIIFAEVIPGMLRAAEELLKFHDIIVDDDKLKVLSLGNTVSTTMLTALCSELLLKYKLQLEGKKIEPIHELSKLFRSLSEESQKDIEKEYQTNISTLSEPPIPFEGWETVDSIFANTNDAFVYWRYLVAIDKNDKGRLIFPYRLYIAALSIYETIHIAYQDFGEDRVIDPELKASIFEHLTDK